MDFEQKVMDNVSEEEFVLWSMEEDEAAWGGFDEYDEYVEEYMIYRSNPVVGIPTFVVINFCKREGIPVPPEMNV